MSKHSGIQIGSIIISNKGRDAGYYFVVVNLDKQYVYYSDGDIRKFDNPKKKIIRHVTDTKDICDLFTNKKQRDNINNSEIKKYLKEYIKHEQDKEEN